LDEAPDEFLVVFNVHEASIRPAIHAEYAMNSQARWGWWEA
jgi:hypothetical protein